MRIRDLGKTIDRLIKVDPTLEKQLKPIKNKSKRWPQKNESYWEELFRLLNSDELRKHPLRPEMQKIFAPQKSAKSPIYSFLDVGKKDKILGAVPEDIADAVRKHDLKSIRIAKLRTEATMTRNIGLIKKVLREGQLLEINSKKIWVKIRDHFKLWGSPVSHNIKNREGILFLVEATPNPEFIGNGLVKMDSGTLREFFKFLNTEPPPGLFGD